MTETASASQTSSSSNTSLESAALVRSLDDLLERYLGLLHQYQSLQQSLSRELSSGYLSLAKANFSNQNRMRYGQDFYDERMQASSRVSITSPKGTMSSIQLLPPSRTTAPSSPASQEQPTDHQLNPSLPKPSEEEPNVVVRDPLNWFGILVPPALRQAQGSFRLAAGDFVPKMATVVREMREVEVEVGRARKRLARLQQKKEG